MKPLNIDESLRKAEAELSAMDKSPLSVDAFEEFKANVAQYVKELLQQSIILSKKQGLNIVSATHVEASAQYLARFKKDKWKDFNNTISGILLGAMISNLFGYLFLDAKISTAGIVFTIVCGAVGAFMVGVNYKNDL